jgi:ABC-type glycerol-3-phosphate transport system substrate-binding protein
MRVFVLQDMFKAAGLDPEKPPQTDDDVKKAAAALSKGKPGAGASFAIYGWFMEQFFANQGAEYLDNGNGRTEPHRPRSRTASFRSVPVSCRSLRMRRTAA